MFNEVNMTLCGRTGRKQTFCVRQCSPSDMEEILRMQEDVIKGLKNKAVFVKTTREELADSLINDFCIGAYSEKRLAALTVMVKNRVSERNLGAHLGYSDEQMKRCVTYDATFVHPDFRGFGLQLLFGEIKDAEAMRLGVLEALATVSPDNAVSLANAGRMGFAVTDRRNMYTGVDRYILKKQFTQSR